MQENANNYAIVSRSESGLNFPASDTFYKNQVIEVLNKLLERENIFMITDLTEDQIKLSTRIALIAEGWDIDIWTRGLGVYMELLLSRRRKSREEIIRALEGQNHKKSFGERFKDLIKPET